MKFQETKFVRGVALCQPAVRMLVLTVGIDRSSGEIWHYTEPVVSLMAFGNSECAEVQITALIVDDEFGLIHWDDPGLECDNTIRRLFSAPWDPSEDDAKLDGDIEGLKNDLQKKLKRKQSE